MSSFDFQAERAPPFFQNGAFRRWLGLLALGCGLGAGDILLRPWAPAPALALLPLLGIQLGYFAGRREQRFGEATIAPPAYQEPTPTLRPLAPPSIESILPQTPKLVDDDPLRDQLQAMRRDLSALDVFNEIQSRQLLNVVTITDEAARAISASASRADASGAELIDFLRESSVDDKVGRAVNEIEVQLQTCRNLLARFSKAQAASAGEEADQRERVVEETSAVLKTLKGVDEIALQTTILSINVAIEAARAGIAGKGFTVIAREIRELASRAKAIAADAGARIETLRRSVCVDLQEDARRRQGQEQGAFNAISVALEAFAQNVDSIVNHEREATAKAQAAGETISTATLDVLSRLQFQDIVRQQLEQLVTMTSIVRDHLVGFSVALSEQGASGDGASLADKLDEHFKHYTMESQRDAHRAATGRQNASAPALLIEMF